MSHDHQHPHDPSDEGRAFAIGTALNVALVVVQVIFGLRAHSMALLADAAHNLSDVLGLVLAWGASALARSRPTPRRTYGLRRTTILAALANCALLLVGVGGVAWESVGRLRAPHPVAGGTMLGVAALSILVNLVSALPFLKRRKADANVRAAFLHLISDAGVSLGVVAAAAVIMVTGWSWLDPAASLAVSAVILAGMWSLLRDALNLALDMVPEHIDPEKVRAYLAGLAGAVEVHDLHVWAMSTTETALTAHLVVQGCHCQDGFVRQACAVLHERFDIAHATLQLEPEQVAHPCRQASEGAV